MKKTIAGLLSLFFVIVFSTAFAQYYQWVDKDGVKHFTDNILEVPENQRPGVQIHQSIDTPPSEKPGQGPEGIIEEDQNTKTLLVLERGKLNAEKNQLESEYKVLQQKNTDLESRTESMAIEEYMTQIKQLNQEIKAFEKKRLDYEARVQSFNRKITDAVNEKPPVTPKESN